MDKNINREQLGRMKQKAGSAKHRAGPRWKPRSVRQLCSRRCVTDLDSEVAREAFELQQKGGISHRDALFKAGHRKDLFSLRVNDVAWKLGLSLVLFLPRPGPQEQTEG